MTEIRTLVPPAEPGWRVAVGAPRGREVTALTMTVHGTPAAQGSKRHVGHGVMVEMAGPRLKSWREAVRSEAQRVLGAGGVPILDGPVSLSVDLWMPRPKSHFRTGRFAAELRADAPRWVASTPDLDKVLRSVLDALTDAGWWRDDRQVAAIFARQQYNLTPGADIRAMALPMDDPLPASHIAALGKLTLPAGVGS